MLGEMLYKLPLGAMSFMNECFRGFNQYAYHSKALDKLSPQNRELFLKTYQESLGLSDVNTSSRIDEYKAAREKALTSMRGVPLEADPPLLRSVSESFRTLDLAIGNIGARYHPDNLTQYIHEEREKALALILEQYHRDVALIESTITDPMQKKNYLATLQSTYTTQKKALEDNLKKDIDALHKAVETEQFRVSTFAVLRHESERIKKATDIAFLRKKSDDVSISIGGEGGVFKDLNFDTLVEYVGGNFKTLTGRTLNVTKTGSDPDKYAFSLDLPYTRSWFSDTSYYKADSTQSIQDFLLMATMLKLAGEQKPVGEVTGFTKNPNAALRMGQDMYAAMLMAGYAPADIKVNINGKVYTAGDKDNNFEALFKNSPSRKQELDIYIKMHQRKQKPNSFAKMKQELEDERKKYESPASTTASADASTRASAGAAPSSGDEDETPKVAPPSTSSSSDGSTSPASPPGGGGPATSG